MPDNKLKPDNTPNLESWRIYFGGAIFWGILAFALLIINISQSGAVIVWIFIYEIDSGYWHHNRHLSFGVVFPYVLGKTSDG